MRVQLQAVGEALAAPSGATQPGDLKPWKPGRGSRAAKVGPHPDPWARRRRWAVCQQVVEKVESPFGLPPPPGSGGIVPKLCGGSGARVGVWGLILGGPQCVSMRADAWSHEGRVEDPRSQPSLHWPRALG